MAAQKFLALVSGRIRQVVATIVSLGASSDGALVALDASGKLDTSVLPAGIGQNTVSATASEALSAGQLCNIYNNTGVVSVRKADATAEGKEANGFVKAAFASGATVTVYVAANVISGLSGLTPGARQYLATTAGARTETPPNGSGNVVHDVGYALDTTSMMFDPNVPVTLA